jgi:predicted AlkP superfamily pyrophosphatase or phosphodiesterase
VRKQFVIKLLLAVLLVLVYLPVSRSEGRCASPRRPKLVLIVVIDQLRYDYLERFRPQFVEGGFRLLLEGGANFVDCRYDYTTTETGPGHATLLTGAYGNIHGIVANDWYDHAGKRSVYCVDEPGIKQVGGDGGKGSSPRNLLVSTLGDELRLATEFQSRVITIAGKDRAAVLMGGHTANAAYWYKRDIGQVVSSTYYMRTLPRWVADFNDGVPTKAYCGKPWQALPETPGAGSKVLREFRPEANEPCPDRKFLEWFDLTPFKNEVLANFAKQALANENLGRGPAADLLAISLSANDYVGHNFGPYSPEVADATLRTDRYLASLFGELDRTIGLDNVWIVLSADHGVAPTPAFIREHGLGSGIFHPATVRTAVEQALAGAFGRDQWVESFEDHDIYLDLATLKRHKVERGRAEAIAAEAAASVPGVWAAWTRTQFLTGTLPGSPLARMASNSFHSQRSGDVMVVLAPYAVAAYTETTTTHGSPWNYDTQVPLILWGSSFRPGVYAHRCQPIDLAPTLAAALGLAQPSGAQGQPLAQALK